MDPTKVLKHVCELMKLRPSPKYIHIPKGGGCLSYVTIKNRQYAGKICGSLAEARASAAGNALEKILEDNKDLKKDEFVQEYMARLEDCEVFVHHQVGERSVIGVKYGEALTSMRDVKVGVILKALKKQKNRAEREKFLAMSLEERYKCLETI